MFGDIVMGVGSAIKEQVICEREHILGHLNVTPEHLLEVIQKPRRFSYVVKEPRRAVHPVHIAAAVFYNAPMPVPDRALISERSQSEGKMSLRRSSRDA